MQLAAGADIPVPETVQAVIAARLDTLHPSGRRSSTTPPSWASLLGGRAGFHERARRARGGARPPDGRQEGAHASRPDSSVKGQAEYSFGHLLIRDVAYQQIPRAARVRKHRTAAAWIERLAGDRVTDHAEILAHHYGQALQLAKAAGLDDDMRELEAQARRFLIMAGDRALELDARKAEAFYRQALELCPPRHPDRARLLEKTAEAALVGGRLSEAQRDFEEAIVEFRAQGETSARARRWCGWPGRTGSGARQTETGAPRAGDRAARARAARTRACPRLHAHRRRPHGRQPFPGLRGVVGEGPGPGPGARARCRGHPGASAPGLARCQLSDVVGGLADLRKRFASASISGWGTRRSGPTETSAIGCGSPRVRPGAWTSSGRGSSSGSGAGSSGHVGQGRDALASVRPRALGRAASLAGDVIEWDRRQSGGQVTVVALTYMAYVFVCRGALSQAHALAEEFLPRAREIRDPQVLVPAVAVVSLIEHARGKPFNGRPADRGDRGGHPGSAGLSGPPPARALRVCVAAGALRLAEVLLDTGGHLAARHRYSVLTGRAVLTEARGSHEAANALYAEAAERWADYGFALERGQAALGAGRCLAMGRHREAAPPGWTRREGHSTRSRPGPCSPTPTAPGAGQGRGLPIAPHRR